MISFKLKQDFFDLVYIALDVEQRPYKLVGINLYPGHIKYVLSDGQGDLRELHAEEVSFTRDEALRLSYPEKTED